MKSWLFLLVQTLLSQLPCFSFSLRPLCPWQFFLCPPEIDKKKKKRVFRAHITPAKYSAKCTVLGRHDWQVSTGPSWPNEGHVILSNAVRGMGFYFFSWVTFSTLLTSSLAWCNRQGSGRTKFNQDIFFSHAKHHSHKKKKKNWNIRSTQDHLRTVSTE